MKAAEKQEHIARIRENALSIVRSVGSLERSRASSMARARHGDLNISYRTPFQRLPAMSPALAYMRALLKGKENLPYGLDIWNKGKKVLNIEWRDGGEIEVISYLPGEWEWLLRPVEIATLPNRRP
jgi:hypothetical protein